MLNENLLRLARQTGELIKQTPEYSAMLSAKTALDGSPVIAALLEEYNAQQAVLTAIYQSNQINESSIAAASARLDAIYKEMTASPENIAYDAAREAVETLLREVDAAVIAEITGEEPSQNGCTHDCKTCGGCRDAVAQR